MTHPKHWKRLVQQNVASRLRAKEVDDADIKAKLEKISNKIPSFIWAHKEVVDAFASAMLDFEAGETENQCVELVAEAVEHEVDNFMYYGGLSPSLPKRLPENEQDETPQGKAPEVHHKPDEQMDALSRILARLLSREQDVRKFRKSVLNDKLLTLAEVQTWVKETAAREPALDQITVTFTVNNDFKLPTHHPDDDVQKLPQRRFESAIDEGARACREGRKPFTVGWNRLVLTYPAPSGQHAPPEPVRPGGVLAKLKKLAEQYKDFWPEAAAVGVILTGESFPVARATASIETCRHGAPWVRLRVHPSMSGDEVRALYLSARGHMKGWPGVTSAKGISPEHAKLAVHAVETMRDPWKTKMQKWVTANPKSAYDNRATFARDCRAAYKRLTGWEWHEDNKKSPR